MKTTSIIDRLLAEQRMLTAVERFARHHDRDRDQAKQESHFPGHIYRDLIPLSPLQTGEQYAFEVDLDKCSGCKACVTACHALNGLEETESWRSVGWLHGGGDDKAYQQTITTACHHCAEPGCLHGCPVLAYEKDSITGIVRHLDDQCIGCQYCQWKCPYEVPRYSQRLGVVRKCDMCHGRLQVGEAPACVQSCPNEAIRITVQTRNDLIESAQGSARLFPGAPRSNITLPSTRYLTRRPIPTDVQPAHTGALRPEPAHWPLILMLVLTQCGVGMLAVSAFLRLILPEAERTWMSGLALPALGIAYLGLGASATHLGQPMRAWRIFLGLRRSWLSREALAFGIFAACGAAWTTAYTWTGEAGSILWHGLIFLLGLGGVLTSLMIYHDTKRPTWHARHVAPRFLGTTLVLGGAAGAVMMAATMEADHGLPLFVMVGLSVGIGISKLIREIQGFLKTFTSTKSEYQTSKQLFQGPLRATLYGRFVCGLAGLILMPMLLLPQVSGLSAAVVGIMALVALVAGEICERYLFFTGVALPRMPGGLP